MAAHSSILAWRIPWTEEPEGLQSMGSWTRLVPHRRWAHMHLQLLYSLLAGIPGSLRSVPSLPLIPVFVFKYTKPMLNGQPL